MSRIPGSRITIDYRRPPDRADVFVNRLVYRTPDVIVTIMEHTPLKRPMVIAGETVLENGSPVVWFTFPHAAHDIGRFHRADGVFTGIYANVLTPVAFLDDSHWETTDLFLDVWVKRGGRAELLDEAELEEAESLGWISGATASFARAEAARLMSAAAAGEWPPAVVSEWTLEAARNLLPRGTSA